MLNLFKTKAKKRLDEVLHGAELPMFSKAVMDTLRVLRDPESSTESVADVLQWDPGLVVRVLSTVNSAAYGPRTPIRDVHHAVSFMGRAQLEQLLLAVAVKDTLPSKEAPGFEPTRYWRAASRRAALARTFAEELHPALHAECFTIGLLEDLAVPVLAHARPDDYGPVLQRWNREPERSLQDLEREELGWDHGEIGGMLGSTWELPAELVAAVGKHHTDEADGDVPPAVRLVSMLGGNQADGIDAMLEEGRASYGLEADWVVSAVETAEQQAESLVQAMAA
jgi:HD-like signal output (HDOD) protein